MVIPFMERQLDTLLEELHLQPPDLPPGPLDAFLLTLDGVFQDLYQ